jgi:D-3-phosphoglycerate dehydrogenase
LREQGYHVDTEKGSLGEDELIERLRAGHYTALGIRSKTNVTKKVIDAAPSVCRFAAREGDR